MHSKKKLLKTNLGKKCTPLLFGVLLSLCLAACNNTTPEPVNKEATPTATVAPTASEKEDANTPDTPHGEPVVAKIAIWKIESKTAPVT